MIGQPGEAASQFVMSSKRPATSAHGLRAPHLSESSCKFHFNAATPFAELCTFSPSLLSPSSSPLFPACCHGVFTSALYHLCQQRLRVPIRPSWQIQIVTGGYHPGHFTCLNWVPSSSNPRLGDFFISQFLHTAKKNKNAFKRPKGQKLMGFTPNRDCGSSWSCEQNRFHNHHLHRLFNWH